MEYGKTQEIFIRRIIRIKVDISTFAVNPSLRLLMKFEEFYKVETNIAFNFLMSL